MAVLSDFAQTIYAQKYAHPGENWPDTARRVSTHVLGALGYAEGSHEVTETTQLIADLKFIPGGRYLYAAGRDLHQTQNCVLLDVEDSREGWAGLWTRAGSALMTGAGIGVEYSKIRANGSPISRTGGFASGPCSLMETVNEIGRQVMQGGSRRSAIWAGLGWDHPDIFDFIRIKDWSPALRELKAADAAVRMPMEFTNVSVRLDAGFFEAYDRNDEHAHAVYAAAVARMLKTGEPGFSIDLDDQRLRNACTEIVSADDNDVCNLGSINLARISSVAELHSVVELATLFLLAGTVYSHVPYAAVAETRAKNRRLGLGLMGVHEWLLRRGYHYGPCDELTTWLQAYQVGSDLSSQVWSRHHGLSEPVANRSIAPNGTIGILGMTTTAIEPVFCGAQLRRWLSGSSWSSRVILDPTVERLAREGILEDPDAIEDAYTLSYDVERRVAFQTYVQRYVDQAISSTINLPGPVEDPDEVRDFAEMLYPHLPGLRGITCYPDGARGEQPLTAIPYSEAIRKHGAVVQESEERCVAGACGV